MEFKHLTKQEARVRLTHDLEKLLHTCPTHLREATQREFEGFEKLFARFIYESSGAPINWDKIKRLDEGTVSVVVWVRVCGYEGEML